MTIKTALVTGAAAGIGKACAIRLAEQGYSVGVLDLNLDDCQAVVSEIEAGGGKALALQASITDAAQVKTAANELRTTFGPIVIVVNNAGVSNFIPFEELEEKDWDFMFDVNVKGTFIVTKECLSDMKETGWGRIINISSSSAQTGSIEQVHYSSSKGAVISMTRSLAQAVGKYGITVNNIPPGAVLGTIMSEENIGRFRVSMDQLKAMIPVGRTGVADDIANTVVWLASEGAGYVSGQTIGVNGGRVVS